MLGETVDLVRLGRTVISMGMCVLAEPLVAARCSFKEVKLVFPPGYSIEDFEMTARAFDADHVDPALMVSETIALDALPDVFERLRAGAKALKVLVDPSLQTR